MQNFKTLDVLEEFNLFLSPKCSPLQEVLEDNLDSWIPELNRWIWTSRRCVPNFQPLDLLQEGKWTNVSRTNVSAVIVTWSPLLARKTLSGVWQNFVEWDEAFKLRHEFDNRNSSSALLVEFYFRPFLVHLVYYTFMTSQKLKQSSDPYLEWVPPSLKELKMV